MRHLIDLVTESHRKTYTQDQLAELFTDPERYQKVGVVEARLAIVGETIVTVIDGEIETINAAQDDDVVVKNPGGEEYIIARTKFEKRYDGAPLTHDYQNYLATGTTYAIEWEHGRGQFEASWGETMIINNGDMLCSPTREPDGDLYRIEAMAFAETYEEFPEDD